MLGGTHECIDYECLFLEGLGLLTSLSANIYELGGAMINE
jgi:hypothetical protein